jgi:hypothetical protein
LLAALVIGLMLLMAGGGLAFMLMTQAQRRAQDVSWPPRRPGKQLGVAEEENPPLVASVAPDKLAALAYLPSDVNFLAAARIPELSAHPLGAQLLRQPLKIGGAEHPLSELPSWLGLRLEDIDHLVLGVRVQNDLVPPFYLVFRTVQPYDAERVRQRLKATRAPGTGKKRLYAFRAPRWNVPLSVWFADERTMVLALVAAQLEALPNEPVADLEQFDAEIRTVLKERREAAAPLWLAGHSSDWSKTLAARFLTRMKKEDWRKLSSLRTFGIWIVPEKTLSIKGVFACKDEAGTRQLDEYLRSLPGPEAQVKTARDGVWLLLQFQGGPDLLTRTIER